MKKKVLKFADIFCGIGGFHIAAVQSAQELGIGAECVFASDIDRDAQIAYEANFGIRPAGDIIQVQANEIPDHDILCGGFPCQAFSICGDGLGFKDARGTLFFELARILDSKKPSAFIFENVKQLKGHDGGRTLGVIMGTLRELGYFASYKVLNALDFGVPQKRERILIVGFKEQRNFVWPRGGIPMKPLSEILEPEEKISPFYFASPKIQANRILSRTGKKNWDEPTIWHENKGGNISANPFSCAMRAGASHNYLLVNGTRRLTEREMLRLQGFPEDFKIVCDYGATRKQVGNSVAVPCISAVMKSVILALEEENEGYIAQMQAHLSAIQPEFVFGNSRPYSECTT